MWKPRRFVAVWVSAALMSACAGSASRPVTAPSEPDHAFARAAFWSMALGMMDAAKTCQATAARLSSLESDKLLNICMRHLVHTRDALNVAGEAIDPWRPDGAATIGCAGKVVQRALALVRAEFERRGVAVPTEMRDGEQLAGWAAQWATASCDPTSPSTTLTVTVPSDLPPVPIEQSL